MLQKLLRSPETLLSILLLIKGCKGLSLSGVFYFVEECYGFRAFSWGTGELIQKLHLSLDTVIRGLRGYILELKISGIGRIDSLLSTINDCTKNAQDYR